MECRNGFASLEALLNSSELIKDKELKGGKYTGNVWILSGIVSTEILLEIPNECTRIVFVFGNSGIPRITSTVTSLLTKMYLLRCHWILLKIEFVYWIVLLDSRNKTDYLSSESVFPQIICNNKTNIRTAHNVASPKIILCLHYLHITITRWLSFISVK